MKRTNWLAALAAACFLLLPGRAAAADAPRSLQDESFYDVLIDRYYNGSSANDRAAQAENGHAFAGGDFAGLADKLPNLQQMGFTALLVGPVLAGESYDGSRATSASAIEPHFGEPGEFKALLASAHEAKIKIVPDFPIGTVSARHEWAQNPANAAWVKPIGGGRARIDTAQKPAQRALMQAALDFAHDFPIDGLRLTHLEGADPAFLGEFIRALKTHNKGLYIVSDEESAAPFDLTSVRREIAALQQMLSGPGSPSNALVERPHGSFLQIDSLRTPRFTYAVAQKNLFPPTRIKLALGALLTLPGVPSVTYGSEIALNGEGPPAAHGMMDFRTKEDIEQYIGDVQMIRNKSAALRTGRFQLLHDDGRGFVVYKRWNADETWIVVVNNTERTGRFAMPADAVGTDKLLTGMFGRDNVREADDHTYRLIVDRELVELFLVKPDTGLNVAYFTAMGLAYGLFLLFLVLVWRKGRQRRADADRP